MKDGDIFFWRWKDDERHKDCGPYRSYHCRSQMAIFRKGHLYDTFWHGLDSDSRLNVDAIIVEYQGNADEMREIRAWEADYYHKDSIVDMRHSNATRAKVYAKVGAERDPDTMREFVQYQVERNESTIRSATSSIEQLNEAIAAINDGRLDDAHIPVSR